MTERRQPVTVILKVESLQDGAHHFASISHRQLVPKVGQSGIVKKLRILLADDHTVMRTGCARCLERQPNLEVVGGIRRNGRQHSRGLCVAEAGCGNYGDGMADSNGHSEGHKTIGQVSIRPSRVVILSNLLRTKRRNAVR